MGDYRYGGFTNDQLANYLGISVPQLQMVQEVMQGGALSPGTMDAVQQLAMETGGGPMGGANRLENILSGIANIQQHPLGSKHHGFNPTSILANFATGGLYGLGKAAFSGDPMQMAAAGAVPTSPGGIANINTELRGPQSTLIAAGGTLAGAGLAGAFSGADAAAGIGGAGPSAASGSNIPYLVDPSGATSQMVIEGAGGAFPGATMTPSGLEAALGSGGALAGAGGGASGGGGSELALGLGGAQLLANMFAPQGGGGGAMPAQMAMPAGPQTQGAPSGALLGGVGGDVPGVGFIDPDYIKSQKGKGKGRGIANQEDLSRGLGDSQMAALYGFTGR